MLLFFLFLFLFLLGHRIKVSEVDQRVGVYFDNIFLLMGMGMLNKELITKLDNLQS